MGGKRGLAARCIPRKKMWEQQTHVYFSMRGPKPPSRHLGLDAMRDAVPQRRNFAHRVAHAAHAAKKNALPNIGEGVLGCLVPGRACA